MIVLNTKKEDVKKSMLVFLKLKHWDLTVQTRLPRKDSVGHS